MLKIGDEVIDPMFSGFGEKGRVVKVEDEKFLGIKIRTKYAILYENGFCGWYLERNVRKINQAVESPMERIAVI